VPLCDIIIKAVIPVMFLLAVLSLFFPTSLVITKISICMILFEDLLIPVAAAVCLIKGFKPAKSYLLAFSFLLFGTILNLLMDFEILPYGFWGLYGPQVGSAIEVALLSFALADRINILKKEKETAQEKAITMKEDYARLLEKQVLERTSELEIEKNKLKAQNDIFESEIALAKKIQLQLIPEPDPTIYIYSLYKPMHGVGGDLYDFFHFRDSNKIGIFVSDVSGHGVPAAFITSMIKTTILQSGNKKEDPAELLSYINDVLQNQTAGKFITAFYGIYEPDNYMIHYASAGHPTPYIITDDGVTQLPKGRDAALALFSNSFLAKNNKSYKNFNEKLPDNSKLIFYTDGLTEARPVNRNLFFEDDIMMTVFMNNRNLSSFLFINALHKSLIKFRGEDSFDDDVCVVCLDVI
jgi:serine phosphatase RsbU (regulator of sigma subunit)